MLGARVGKLTPSTHSLAPFRLEAEALMLKKIHHIGIVVRNLEEAFKFYKDTLGLPLGKMAIMQDQGVKAALLPVGESEIELLEPITPDTGVAKFLEKKGGGLHHLCFETD